MRKFLVAGLCLLSLFAANAGTMFWQITCPDVYAFANAGALPERFGLYGGIEDTLLGECLFLMELENLTYDDDNDWIGEILKTCSCRRCVQEWNSLKNYYSMPRVNDSRTINPKGV